MKVFCSCAILYVAKCNLGNAKLQANVVPSGIRDLWGDSTGLCLSLTYVTSHACIMS